MSKKWSFFLRAGAAVLPVALGLACSAEVPTKGVPAGSTRPTAVGSSGGSSGGIGNPVLGTGTGTGSSSGLNTSGGGTGVATGCATVLPPQAPMRRLTRWEYNNTVNDLLGDVTRPADKFAAEAAQFGFDNNASGAVLSSVVVEQFEAAAGLLATEATKQMPALLGCDPAVQGNDTCATAFIGTFFQRTYRRPLSTAETTRLQAFYQQANTAYGFAPAIQMLVKSALQSPNFLYRLEFGMPAPTAQGAVPLGPFELASRLSYLFTGSMPDAALFTAAEQGQLSTPAQVFSQATRLLESERGARVVKNYYRQWAGLADLSNLDRKDPAYTAETRQLLVDETETFADQVVRLGDGQWATLLTAPYTYMNQALAGFYGMTGPTGTDFVKVPLAPDRYTGFLTQASQMARLAHPGQPSPVLRGKFIRDSLLCSPLPPPPNNVDATLPPPDPKATARQQLTQKTSVTPCSGCHSLLNPPGFAFEHFDELGRYRADDHGLPIDSTGDLTGTDVDGPFANQIELMSKLSQSKQVRSCVVTNWFRYAYGRDQTANDTCSVQDLSQVFESSNGNVKQLLLSLTQTPAFLYRDAVGTGAQP